MKVPDSILKQLREDLACRRIDAGLRCLQKHRAVLKSYGPDQQGAVVLLGYISQWVDVGYRDAGLVEQLLTRFAASSREDFSLLEYIHLEMANGLVAMSKEEFAKATRHFSTVLALGDDIQDKEPIAIANFWLGRSLRRQGQYSDALGYIRKGKELALQLQYPKMAAVMQVAEGWIAFQEGDVKKAARILGEAEAVLSDTDDCVTRGNIYSAYGRIARRQGYYDQALHHFGMAVNEYNKRNPYHRNLARSHVNIAFVKRLLAIQIANRIDREAAQSRNARINGESKNAIKPRVLQDRINLSRLRGEAFSDLSKAEEIYRHYDDHRGHGNVLITQGYLHLDGGELDRTASLAAAAFEIANAGGDVLLKARCRILQCAVECAKKDAEIDENLAGTVSLQAALEFGHEALEYARATQNIRLIAKACIGLGLALSLDLVDYVEEARKCADEATTLINPQREGHDYLWRELQDLNRRVRDVGDINPTLREWSQGIVGRKKFQQITEEFARIVIPKVWKREGCRVSRVAVRLSISPKKVRRILREQGIRTTLVHSDKSKR